MTGGPSSSPVTPVVLPAMAAAAAGAVLVGNRRGQVVHLAVLPAAALTSSGRLRRGHGPVCAQRGRVWRCWPIDGRPLCGRCLRTAGPADDPSFMLTPAQRAELVVASLRTARDERTWLACRRLAVDLTQLRVDGTSVGEHVRAARNRLNAEPQPRLFTQRSRLRRSAAPPVRVRRPDPSDLSSGSL